MSDERPRTLAITEEKFLPYALAVGQMALAWNELHEALGILFAWSLRTSKDRTLQAIAIWGAVTSDRQKRQLLEASINYLGEESHRQFPQLAADILWLVGRANSLEDKRNNVVHSPLAEITSDLVGALLGLKMGEVFPGGILNERALKLRNSTILVGKDLLNEMIVYRDYAEKLASFSDSILTAWRKPVGSWPERPSLPPLKDRA